MPDQILLRWTPLVPSRLARRLAFAACMLASCAALALSIAAVLQLDAVRGAIALIAWVVVGFCLVRAVIYRTELGDLSLADGDIRVRSSDSNHSVAALPLFVSPLLIALRQEAAEVTIVWSDALQADGYRRLSAACRWHLARTRQRTQRGQDRSKNPSAQTESS